MEVAMVETDEKKPRELTNDERHAAEAAFRGEPLNPTWSEKARIVYARISSAVKKRHDEKEKALLQLV